VPRSPIAAAGMVLLAASCAADWPAIRGGPSNAAWVDLGALLAPTEGWRWRPTEETRSYAGEAGVFSSPAVSAIDGRAVAFVGCYDHNVYAVDIASGTERWRFSTGGPVYGTPCVANLVSGPLVFVGSSDRTLYALDARDGTKRWAVQLVQWRASVGRAALASPALFVYGGKPALLLCAWVYDRSAVTPLEQATATAYEAESGKLLWRLELGTSALASPAVLRYGQRTLAIVGGADGKLWGLDLGAGDVAWRTVLQGEIWGTAGTTGDGSQVTGDSNGRGNGIGAETPRTTAGHGTGRSNGRKGAAPIALIGTRYGQLHAVDALTGRRLWSFRTQRAIDSSPAIAEVDGVLTAFFGSHDQSLYAISALTGDLLWRFHTKGDVYSSAAVFQEGSRELVAFTSGDDRLYVLDAKTGTEVWSTLPGRYLWGYRVVGDSLWSSPVVVRLSGTDTIVLPFYDGEVHAYPVTTWATEPSPTHSSYGKQMLARVLLAMAVTLVLCIWLVRRRKDD
jgi:outer membrane protein assembly factor BamB